MSFFLSGALPSESSTSQSRDNAVSPWWENVRHTLAQSTATNRALSIAAVCRAVAMEISTASRKVEVIIWDEERLYLNTTCEGRIVVAAVP